MKFRRLRYKAMLSDFKGHSFLLCFSVTMPKNKCISAVLERTEHLSATCPPPAPVLSVLIAFKTPFKTWKKPLREEGLFTVEEDKDVTRSAVQLVKFLINHRGFQNKADCSGNLCKSWQFFL